MIIINKEKKAYVFDLETDVMVFITDSILKAQWDVRDERFFILQKRPDKGNQGVETYFYSTENGARRLDGYKFALNEQELIAVSVPYIYYFHKVDDNYEIHEELIKDFQGLDVMDEITIQAIMNFNYFLCIGTKSD